MYVYTSVSPAAFFYILLMTSLCAGFFCVTISPLVNALTNEKKLFPHF
jgi:hypothetical protein